MKIKVNGEEKTIKSDSVELDLEKLVKDLGHNPKLVVVEFNGKILSPSSWNAQIILDGDVIEIVTIVGGGS